jgi:hypothetical protein
LVRPYVPFYVYLILQRVKRCKFFIPLTFYCNPRHLVCDNSNVIHARRANLFLLGIWIGGSILVSFATFANFSNIDDVLQTPGSVRASVELNKLGRDDARRLLRRYVGEDNAEVIFNWERVSAAIGVSLFFLLLFGDDQPLNIALGGVLLMTAIVLGQHFITPEIADLARKMDDLPADTSMRARFGVLHGTYGSLEILKVLTGFIVAWRLMKKERRETGGLRG